MKKDIKDALATLKDNGVTLDIIKTYLGKDIEPEEKTNYFVYGIGDEGVEGVLDLEKESSSLSSFQLRCRYNSQRNIKLYGVKTCVDRETLRKALCGDNKSIIKKSIELGY